MVNFLPIVVSLFVAAVQGVSQLRFVTEFNVTTPDCHRPPLKRGVEKCCGIPIQGIWGDMTISLQACGRKVRIHSTSPLSRISDVTTVLPEKKELTPEVTNDDETTQQTIPKDLIRQKPTHGKRYKSHHRGRKELLNNKVDTEIVMTRFKMNAADNDEWRAVALAAGERCLQKNFGNETNSLCQSGSFELFQCVLKEVFQNCPSWKETDTLCTSLKKYYERCPNISPPSFDEKLLFVNGENTADGSSN
ncbi:hypothetical protein RUM44_012732 [Polyplax serrata]|uniref:Uncharacterized protein n=1 Tax=Polyplax serrata TaxID=468196 RepID=A0ABR1BH10_POLSC